MSLDLSINPSLYEFHIADTFDQDLIVDSSLIQSVIRETKFTSEQLTRFNSTISPSLYLYRNGIRRYTINLRKEGKGSTQGHTSQLLRMGGCVAATACDEMVFTLQGFIQNQEDPDWDFSLGFENHIDITPVCAVFHAAKDVAPSCFGMPYTDTGGDPRLRWDEPFLRGDGVLMAKALLGVDSELNVNAMINSLRDREHKANIADPETFVFGLVNLIENNKFFEACFYSWYYCLAIQEIFGEDMQSARKAYLDWLNDTCHTVIALSKSECRDHGIECPSYHGITK